MTVALTRRAIEVASWSPSARNRTVTLAWPRTTEISQASTVVRSRAAVAAVGSTVDGSVPGRSIPTARVTR
ncbi:hypothetical protein [Actinotalea sp. K2]|uniref:hypothetical protein n=1 Tax=Actinotalea sp. K2 TaxID=2939438 RepID=UPI002017C00A|nr:hypothetical protein [Actinotalea sp. K2]MCL3862260.1 hypothetical protein [Actinotalea sp. K2]